MQTKTLKGHSLQDIKAQIEQYNNEGFNPTLGIVFTDVSFDLQEVSAFFKSKDIALFGCSTAGEIIGGDILDKAFVGLLFDLDKSAFKVELVSSKDSTTFKSAQRIGHLANEAFQNPAVIIGSGGLETDGEQIVYGVLNTLKNKEVPVFGGLAADDWNLQGTYAFSNKEITDDGMVILILDNDKVEVNGLAICGWEAVGKENLITKAVGNTLYTINDEPALDVFLKYFGYFDDANIKGKKISTVSAQYPLQIKRDDGTVVLRSPLKANEEDGSLLLAGGVHDGDKFHFSISPGFEVIDKTIEEFGDFKTDVPEADAILLFSCKGRHSALGPLIEDEIQGIYDHWKKPLVGFFTYGEIGASKNGKCDFHNETCSLVLLKEK